MARKKGSKRKRKFTKHLPSKLAKRKHDSLIQAKRTIQDEKALEKLKEQDQDVMKENYKKNKLAKLSVDKFLDNPSQFLDDDENAFGSSSASDNDTVFDAPSSSSSSDDDDISSDDETFESHQQQLASLKATDPAFFAYLKKNGSSLLDFAPPSSSSDDDADAEAAALREAGLDDDDDDNMKKPSKQPKTVVLTNEMIKKWGKKAGSGSLTSLRRLVIAFRAGVLLTNDDNEREGPPLKYKVPSSQVFQTLMRWCIPNMFLAFDRQLNYSPHVSNDDSDLSNHASDSTLSNHASSSNSNTSSFDSNTSQHAAKLAATSNRTLPSESDAWPKVMLTIRSYLNHLHQFVHEVMGNPRMLRFVLQHTHDHAIYFLCFKPTRRRWFKTLVEIWSGSTDERARIAAFFNIRKFTIIAPFPFLETTCIKTMYLAYVRHARFVNPASAPLINFMADCVVEMCGLDFISTYQKAYTYIRQAAVHLRNTLQSRTKQAYLAIYNWQYINSLKLWVSLLVHYPNQQHLKLLIYPLIQVLIGTIRLIRSPKYFPLRLTVVHLLNQLCASNNVFVPVAPYLCEVIEYCATRKALSSSKNANFDLLFQLKVSKSAIQSKQFQERCFSRATELLLDHYYVFAYSIAFPELLVPSKIRLSKFAKAAATPTIKKRLRIALTKLDQHANWISQKRAITSSELTPASLANHAHQAANPTKSRVVVAPSSLSALQTFLPSNKSKKKHVGPLHTYYEQFKKSQNIKRRMATAEVLDDPLDNPFDLERATISRKNVSTKKNVSNKKKKVVQQSIASSSSSSSSDDDQPTTKDFVSDFVLSDSDSDM